MKIKPYVEKLETSKEYKEFKSKNPNSFMIAGFFILDLESGNNVHQIDFYVPGNNKIAAFTLDGDVKLDMLDALNSNIPERLGLNTKIDLDALPGILTDEMHNRGISSEIRKIIAIIQNVGGKRIWNLNCVLTGMEILRSHVEDDSKTVLKIEKTSIMDLMKRMPTPQMKPNVNAENVEDDVKEEMAKLEELQSEIIKEKSNLKKKVAAKGGKKKK